MKRLTILAIWGVLAGLIAADAMAQIHITGIMRDEYALGLTPTLKSMGMGGAYVGVDGIRSMNPASLGGVEGIQGTFGYGFYNHDNGPSAHRGRIDAIFPDPISKYLPIPIVKSGGWRLMVDGVISDGEGTTLLPDPAGNPMDIEFDSVTIGQQSGFNITDWLAVGMGAYPYEKANVDLGPFSGEALSQIGSTQLGVLVRPCEFFNIGAQYIYIKDDLEVNGPTGHMGDYFDINYFAVGVSVMPWDGTLIAVDYWNGEMEGAIDNVTPFDQDVDRWNLGVEQRISDYVDLRLGSNNGGLTAGFTYRITDKIDFDYAYVNKALRDKENVFGETQYHGIAITARF